MNIIIFLSSLTESHTVTIRDIFTPDSPLIRVPRDTKYPSRFDARTDNSDKNLKPEESNYASNSGNLGKRCVRCENGYLDRYPDRNRYNYDDRGSDYDRYDDRHYERDRYYDRDRYGDK